MFPDNMAFFLNVQIHIRLHVIVTKHKTCCFTAYKITSDESTVTEVALDLNAVERKHKNVNAASTDKV